MPAVDVADERLEPDAQRLAGQVVEIGGVLDEQDDRPVGFDHPAEPRPERRAGRDRQRARDVVGGMVARRARVDDAAARDRGRSSSPSPDSGAISGTIAAEQRAARPG